MPTIDDLPAANSVSDSDETVLSQNGNTVKATRAQIVSGLQPALYLPQGSLLGRISAGTGAPETLTIGANLAINAGVITAPAPYEIAQSANGNPVQPTDLVPLAQGGQNAMLNYAAFMSGLGSLPGINASALSVTALGAPGGRSLAAIAADAIPVEAFGAVGDGQTDDTAAFSLALAAGRPLRLDGRVYIVNGQLAITDSTALLGVAQNTVIRRLIAEDPGAWISVAAASLTAFGIVFDAGNLAAVATAWLRVGQLRSMRLHQCLRHGGGQRPGLAVRHECQPQHHRLHPVRQRTARAECRGRRRPDHFRLRGQQQWRLRYFHRQRHCRGNQR
jgi:hypothetical protein